MAPAEAVLEAARWLGSQFPWRPGSPELKTRAAALRGGRARRQRGKEWVQGELRRLGGAPIGERGRLVGGQTGGGGGAKAPAKLEVGDEVEDLTVICKKSRGLNIN